MAGSGGRPVNPELAQSVRGVVGVRSRSAGTIEVLSPVYRIRMGLRKENRVFAISV